MRAALIAATAAAALAAPLTAGAAPATNAPAPVTVTNLPATPQPFQQVVENDIESDQGGFPCKALTVPAGRLVRIEHIAIAIDTAEDRPDVFIVIKDGNSQTTDALLQPTDMYDNQPVGQQEFNFRRFTGNVTGPVYAGTVGGETYTVSLCGDSESMTSPLYMTAVVTGTSLPA